MEVEPNEDILNWNGQRLIVEEAPEPNDIDWEFIHCSQRAKRWGTVKATFLSLCFMASCYFMIKGITHIQSKLVEKAYAEKERGDL